ncbi:hypothetical protein QUR91_01685 [Pseudomonas asiatica]|nr:hypothetical protein [Pseudomonas asiatica]WJN50560.1 hypothetical protein QUR91_01685 [Pseudomonas asiatica]
MAEERPQLLLRYRGQAPSANTEHIVDLGHVAAVLLDQVVVNLAFLPEAVMANALALDMRRTEFIHGRHVPLERRQIGLVQQGLVPLAHRS